ncbi:hypothetical protein [Clostridium sp. C105KSO13]|uniref:hypothetical protein n=1 Tax=Clostridium sp. C105KSO13 TaxID=1776045 RepID=UPI00074072CD|nr:hypothetical protein [Clostridium sp. C105KSO13]CUX15523.1 hypothetical protein BN3456_00105 [Clostridium sp. C105KSO13]
MKHRKQFLILAVLLICMVMMNTMSVFAAELTEAEVEQAVSANGKEAVTGNVFVWFLCAIAFLKVSQKIDSFLSSLGINVGNTGGNMMAELLIAGRSLSSTFRGGGASHRGGGSSASPGSSAVGGSFLSGGLAGSVGRQAERSAVNSATGYSEGGLGSSLYQSSLNKGGDFANNVISKIAHGNYGQVGSIKGDDASKAFTSYMGLNPEHPGAAEPASGMQGSSPDTAPAIPSYSNIEIGGGRITGTEQSDSGSRDFAMYNADQYMAPSKGEFDTVKSVDGATWYKQYAQDTVSKTPYEKSNGSIAYHESLTQQLPPTPPRKERI